VQHSDLDPKASTIHVRRSCGWVRGERGYELTTDLPKSGRQRTVRVPKEVMRVLLTLPSRFRGGPVFTHSDGRPIEPSAVLNRVLRAACARAGLPPIRFHDLRHTYVALSIAEGAHPKYIQQQLGHASIITTLDTYGHLFPAFTRARRSGSGRSSSGRSLDTIWSQTPGHERPAFALARLGQRFARDARFAVHEDLIRSARSVDRQS
jgi:integrase